MKRIICHIFLKLFFDIFIHLLFSYKNGFASKLRSAGFEVRRMVMVILNWISDAAKNFAPQHVQVVPISLFVAVLCLCLLIGHLLEENRWVNESIVAILVVINHMLLSLIIIIFYFFRTQIIITVLYFLMHG